MKIGERTPFRGLGKLLEEGRERKRLTRDDAAMMIGVTNGQYVYRVERGLSTLSVAKLKRALELYGLPASQVAEVAGRDLQVAILEALA